MATGACDQCGRDPNRGWLAQATHRKADQTALSSFAYVHDHAGNRVKMTGADGKYIEQDSGIFPMQPGAACEVECEAQDYPATSRCAFCCLCGP